MQIKHIAIFVVIAFFSFYKLGSTLMNVDAQHWFSRSIEFNKAVKKFDLPATYQDPKPGVTVMWLSGFSLDTFFNLYSAKYGFKPQLYTFDTFSLVNFSAIAPLVCLNLLFLVALYYLVKNIFDENVAILAVIFLGLHPFYLANTRFLHVDSTLSVFMTLSFLTLLYFEKTKKKLYLILSGICAGLALLTKTQALFLFGMTGITLITNAYINKNSFKKVLAVGSIWFVSCVLTFIIIFPAMWVKSVEVIKNIYTEAFYVADSGRTSRQDFTFYLGSLTRVLSIPFMFAFLGTMFFGIKNLKKNKTTSMPLLLLILYTILYFGQMSVVTQKIDRYLIPMFPTLMICVAYGISQFKNKWTTPICFAVMFCLCTYYSPYYETFGTVNAQTNYYGSLYSEVGKYLNSKPNSKNFKVVTMTKAYSLKPFISGTTYGHEESMPANTKINYLVTNDYWLNFYGNPTYFDKCTKEKTIYYHNVLFWDIYKCN